MNPIPYIPHAYQEVMSRWIGERDQWLLFCDMGLGKTVVTLKWISDRIITGESRAVLVIAPIRVMKITWPAQIARWDFSRWMRIADMRTDEGVARWESGDFEVALINPEQLATREITTRCRCGTGCPRCEDGVRTSRVPGFVERFIAKRESLPVDTLVIDEISLARNPSSKRWNALRPHLHPTATRKAHFKAVGGLTGTPIPNSHLDLFAQVRLVDGGGRFGTAYTHYRARFFTSDYMGYKWTIKPGAAEAIDAMVSDLALVMRGEDHLKVPPCTVEDIEIDLPAKARREYDTLEKQLLVRLASGDIEALSAAALYGKLLQMTSGMVYDSDRTVHDVHEAKVQALAKLVKDLEGEPLLVLTRFKHERRRLLERFPQAVRFHEDDLPKWQRGEIPMWVADARNLSHGIDGIQLGGRKAVWVTLTDSPDIYPQTNARLVRPGQAHETTIYRILARNTVDWAVAEALRDKDKTQSGMLKAIRALQLLRK